MSDIRALRMPSEDRRRQILDTAVDLFARKGFAGTTTKEIAAAAGVNEALIFRHFANKEQLYVAILDLRACGPEAETAYAELRDCMARRDDEGLFRALGAKMLRTFRQDERFERLMLYASLEGHEIAKLYMQRMGASFIAFMKEYIESRQREGALADLDPGMIILAAAGMFRFYGQMSQFFGNSSQCCTDEEVVNIFTRILLDGVRRTSPTQRTV